MILSVGYRVNSKRATQFRVWATKNSQRIHNERLCDQPQKDCQKLYCVHEVGHGYSSITSRACGSRSKNVLELIKEFASTWVSLDAYDKQSFTVIGATKNLSPSQVKSLPQQFLSSARYLCAKVRRQNYLPQKNKEEV